MNKNFTKVFLGISAVCSISFFTFLVCASAKQPADPFSGWKAAGKPVPPAIKPPAPAAAVNPAEKIQEPAASCAETQNSPDAAVGHIEFDEFSSINDPLYREGSKALLQKAIDEDSAPAAPVKNTPVKKELWRDAPADIPAKAATPVLIKDGKGTKSPVFPVKKNRLIKLIPADPVETKSTL